PIGPRRSIVEARSRVPTSCGIWRAPMPSASTCPACWSAVASRVPAAGHRCACRHRRSSRSRPTSPFRSRARATCGRCAGAGASWAGGGGGWVGGIGDWRGVQMLAQLVAAPGREIHALELVGDGGGIDTGDAGEHLDTKAKAAYRKRLAELTEEVEEAEAW